MNSSSEFSFEFVVPRTIPRKGERIPTAHALGIGLKPSSRVTTVGCEKRVLEVPAGSERYGGHYEGAGESCTSHGGSKLNLNCRSEAERDYKNADRHPRIAEATQIE